MYLIDFFVYDCFKEFLPQKFVFSCVFSVVKMNSFYKRRTLFYVFSPRCAYIT